MSDRKFDFRDLDINRNNEDEMVDEIERNLRRTYGSEYDEGYNGSSSSGSTKDLSNTQRRVRSGYSSGRRTSSSGSSSSSAKRSTPATKKKKATKGRRYSGVNRANTESTNTKGAKSRGSKRSKKAKNPKKKKILLFIKIFFFLILFVVMMALVVFYFKYGGTIMKWKKEAKAIVNASSADTFKTSLTSVIYDSKGKPLAELKGDKDTYYLEYKDIPEAVVDAFVDVEDQDFYKHKGYDLKAITSASIQLVRSKILHQGIERGGSTITQQLCKLTFLSSEQSLERKLREIFISTEMEKKYTKEEILEFYINNVYFANGYYGIEAAARGYFSKGASELTLGETAFLCAIPNGPSKYDPIENYENTKVRQKLILSEMLDQKDIDDSEFNNAMQESIELKLAKELKVQNYMTTYAIYCATRQLMKANGFKFKYSFSSDKAREKYEDSYAEMYDQCHSSLYTEGYKIYTTLDKKIQKKLQKSVDDQLASFTEKKDKIYTFQGAATCINNETGKVVAVVGGRSQKNFEGYTLNRAYQSPRQPGSCFKPIAVYTPAFESGYTPESYVDDTYFEGGPKNADGSYAGKIPVRTAVEKSKNVIAWKLFEEITPEVGLSYILNMNFAHIVESDFYPAAALGGLTNGATTTEMASAYATLANSGTFTDPTCIDRVLNSSDEVVISKAATVDQKRVYSENAANMMSDVLKGVLIRGTAAGHSIPNMDSAGKTGTTSDYKDGWFCGYTPYYSTAVWVGYDQPISLAGLTGASYPLNIWYSFMTDVNAGLQSKTFPGYTNSSGQTVSTTASPSPSQSAAPGEISETEEDANTMATAAPADNGTTTDTTNNTQTTTDNTQTTENQTTTNNTNNTNNTTTNNNTTTTNNNTNNSGTTENTQNNQTTESTEIVTEETNESVN